MITFVADVFTDEYVGGAELTTDAIMQGCYLPTKRIKCSNLTVSEMKKGSKNFWIFGNFANLSKDCIVYAIKNLNYCVLEYDYKFCQFRSPEKHVAINKKCDCDRSQVGKLVSVFYKKAKIVFFMSDKQKQLYQDKFPFLNDNTKVLSSVFSRNTLKYIESLDTSNKNEKWLILNSDSWIKGRDKAIKTAEEMNLEYELVWGLNYPDLLNKVAKSKGIIFTPPGGDTCPRFVIEAKLLNCEMILNENVQHALEPWFKTKESTYEYLKTRVEVFWGTLEKIWTLTVPKTNTIEEKTKFNIIVPFYNAMPYLSKCIETIKNQKYKNFKCYLIDDLSTDKYSEVINDIIDGDKRFHLKNNKTKKYALRNIVESLESTDMSDEDVNIILDGDDWFSCRNILSFLNKIYCENDTLLTYGSYTYYPWGGKGIEPSKYPEKIIEKNEFRKDKWRASHLRTFKTKLWKRINTNDLKNKDGSYYQTAYDQALMLPMLEMAGDKCSFIPEILHVYNRANPLNVDKTKRELQATTAKEIRSKKPYERLF